MKKSRIIHALVVFLMAGYLFSCSESNIGTDNISDSVATGNVNAVAAKKSHGDSPQKVFEEFQEMVKKVETMSKAEIDSLSDEEILVLGEPILKATEGTVKLNKGALQKLKAPLGELFARSKAMTKAEHKTLSKEIEQIIASARNREIRSFGANDVRNLLLKFNSGATAQSSSTCETMFTVQGQNVILMQGDNFNLANYYCPAGYQFTITSGTHTGQYVSPAKSGNDWLGTGTAIMDGQKNLGKAFTDLQDNSFGWFEIRNYTNYGIISTPWTTKKIIVSNMIFKEIGDGKDGQIYGAIYFEDAEEVEIRDSYFENVASSIRFRESEGPIKVLDNEALNTGRNFLQCIECTGGNIRINGNSLEHSQKYGSENLEDFINIFKSSGTSSDYIQVNNNRARVNLTNGNASGVANSGCFIILGDIGGQYQEAKNNIGVNPGNCGIGVAGGSNFKVEDNLIYSQQVIGISNVGIYGAAFPDSTPCSFSPSTFKNNKSSYICGQSGQPGELTDCGLGLNNWAWAPETPQSDHYCGVTASQIQDYSRVEKDTTLSPGIWNQW